MRTAAATLLSLVLATGASAQEQPTPDPDYSRDNLMRIFVVEEQMPENQPRIELGPGWIDFRALGMRWRFSPLFAPLPGSELSETKSWPDPFLLTGTVIAQTPRTFRRNREVNAELRGLERRVKATTKVKVNP